MLDTSKIYTSNKCGDFKIIDFIKCDDITIEFVLTGYVTKTNSSNIKSGRVKDKLYPLCYGVGYVGDGAHKGSVNRKDTKAYSTWRNMIKRCCSNEFKEKNPAYKDCTVVDEWHNFQNFAEWFECRYSDGLQLDKDIKVKGNKVYGPEFCLLVTQAENIIEAHAKNYKFTSPNGELVELYNLRKFCRNNELSHSSMQGVNNGIQGQHKGWTKAQ